MGKRGKKNKNKSSKSNDNNHVKHNTDDEKTNSNVNIDTSINRSYDKTFRGPSLDELVIFVPNVLSKMQCQQVEKLHNGFQPMGGEHDRQETLSFAHEVWRIETQLKKTFPNIYNRLIRDLMQSIDQYYFEILQVAYENGSLRIINECKRGKDKVLIRPEVEYIVYDADEAIRNNTKLPHIGPHTDNSSALTLVCLLSDPDTFDGGINYFCPEKKNNNKKQNSSLMSLPREIKLKQGECVLFRGESCEHWISDVIKGRRAILQIELALCAGTKDQPISGQQARARSRGNNKSKSKKA